MLLILLFGFVSVLAYVYYVFNIREHYKKYEEFYKIPTPFYVPILGTTYAFFRTNMLIAVDTLANCCGRRFVMYIPHRTYCTSDPGEIQIILNQAIDKSKEYNHLKGPFGNSLLLAKATMWKNNRKLISKSFKQNILDTFVPTFYEKSDILVNRLRRKEYDNIFELFEQLSLDIFIEATIGIKSSILLDNDSHIVKIITDCQRILFGRIGNIFKLNDSIFFMMPDGKNVKGMILECYDFFKRIITMKRKKINEEIILNSRNLPFLDLLIDSAERESFTDDYIANETVLFAAAASDTTAYSIVYILCILAMHPEEQQKVFNEIIEVIGENEITTDDLIKLKYTEMAINEAQRLVPVVPMVARLTHCDLDIGTCVVPKDTGLLIYILNLHRDENIYPEPLKYDPNRFLPENVAKRHPYSFIPFSGGPRNCIGKKYAQMSVKITVANVIRNFVVTTPYKSITELKFESSVVMNTTHPLEINFIPRKGN